MKIEDISNIKSSTGLVKLFSDELINSVLDSNNEEIVRSPAGFIPLIFSSMADLAANSFFEQQMIKREMHKNTAILTKSLIRYLNDNEIAGVFASPATANFFIAFPYDALIKRAIVDPTLGGANIRHARINKESSVILLSKAVFVLDHSIDIYILNAESDKPTINISYDMMDKYSDNFTSIVNAYINNRIFNYNGMKYVGFNIIGREYQRNYQTFNLDLETISDQIIYYDNQLMGFEILYKAPDSTKFTLLTGYPEGVDPISGYNYSLSKKTNGNYIKISFGKRSTSFSPSTRSIVKACIYTTTGSAGNIKFPNIDADIEKNVQFILKQDSVNPYEQAIATLTPLVTVKDVEATGGKDQMTFDEIRAYVINKSSVNKTITPSDIERRASEFNCTAEKIRHDIKLMYKLNTILRDDETGDYLSSGSGVFRFNLDDVPLRTEIKARMLKPNFIYKLDQQTEQYNYQVNPVSLQDYLVSYRNNKESEVCFPYFIKTTFTDTIKASVYNMAFDKKYFTEMDYYDAYALDTVAIDNMTLLRNPTLEKPTEEEIQESIEGFYSLSFNAVLGKNLYDLLSEADRAKDPIKPIKFKILISNPISNKDYIADCDIIEKSDMNMSLRVRAVLFTNNNINDDNDLCITNKSLKPCPIPLVYESFYYVNQTINVKIMVLYNNEEFFNYRDQNNDKYLTSEELNQKYYISTIYGIENVVLVEDLTEKFNLSMDIKLNNTIYKTYESDQYLTYTETIYEVDEHGETLYEEKSFINDAGSNQTIRVPVVKHHKGDIVLNEENKPTIIHKQGEIIYENGEPIIERDDSYYVLLKTVPWFDRIFNVSNKYFDIENAYKEVISIHSNIAQTIIDGVDLSIGFKRTSGKSNLYSIYNNKTEMYESLDNIALSLNFGVSFNSVMSDEDIEYNILDITQKTKEYINNITEIFSISELFRYLKTNIPSINYCVHYSINNYDSNTCQSIHKDTKVSASKDEILCTKMDIDEENSDFNEGNIIFKPAINISII